MIKKMKNFLKQSKKNFKKLIKMGNNKNNNLILIVAKILHNK